MSHDEVYAHAADQGGNAVTEFHIVGGLHPDLPKRRRLWGLCLSIF